VATGRNPSSSGIELARKPDRGYRHPHEILDSLNLNCQRINDSGRFGSNGTVLFEDSPGLRPCPT
jgi:hypothetical protein